MKIRILALTLLAAVVLGWGRAEAVRLPALGNVTSNNDKQAATVTTGTGATAVIPGSSPLSGAAMAISDTGYDASAHRMFVVDASNSKLLTISMLDGSIQANPPLGLPAGVTGVTDLEWSGAVLYGIVTLTGGAKQLATFNTATGAVTLIGAGGIGGGASIGTFSQPFDLDAAGNRYYMVGSPAAGDTLYAINTATGGVADSVLLSAKLPAGTTTIFGLEWHPAASTLFALVGLSGGDKRLATVNTTSGATFGNITLLGPGGIGGGSSVSLSGAEALDPTGNVYYAKGSVGGVATLFEISTTTGVATLTALSFGSGINDVRALEFDAGPLPVELARFTVE